jgi:hypothetical protein
LQRRLALQRPLPMTVKAQSPFRMVVGAQARRLGPGSAIGRQVPTAVGNDG